uniref:Uncharacterized protein n=1 Tax=Timema monikensis TaxID=170555 RepID=A0A7R9EIG5_9NEOP|nr:unnamed protein product [Timema monikensis]
MKLLTEYILDRIENNGDLSFPHLRTSLTSKNLFLCWGRYTWQQVDDFSINNHLIVGNSTFRGRPVSELNIQHEGTSSRIVYSWSQETCAIYCQHEGTSSRIVYSWSQETCAIHCQHEGTSSQIVYSWSQETCAIQCQHEGTSSRIVYSWSQETCAIQCQHEGTSS